MIKIFTAIKTTGRNPWKHGITEIAMMAEEYDKVIDVSFTKMNPGDVEFDPKALEINNETQGTIQTQMPLTVANVMIRNFLDKHAIPNEKYMLVSYNAQFVYDFLAKFFRPNDPAIETNIKGISDYFYYPPLDVMQMANIMLQEIRPSISDFKLDTICQAFDVNVIVQPNTCINKAKQIYCLYRKLIES